MENHGRATADHDGLRAGLVGPALYMTVNLDQANNDDRLADCLPIYRTDL